jgi:large subunit ribosomal protein L35
MPKMKSHSSAKKRFKKSAGGKLTGHRAFSSHNLEHKSPKRKRQMRNPSEISKADRPRVEHLRAGRKGR